MPEDRIGISYHINLGKLTTSIRGAKTHLSNFNKWVETSSSRVSQKTAISGAEAELKKLGITSRMTATDIKRLGLSNIDLQRVFELTKKRMKELTKEVAGGGRSAQGAAREYSRLQKRLPELQHEVNKHISAFGDYRRAMDRWGQGFKYMIASQAAWIASGMLLFGTLTRIVQGLKDVATTHQELKNLEAITRANRKEMDMMEQSIRRASVGTKFFAADMTKVATIMAQAGFNAREIAQAISAVAVLASATGRDLTDVADLMTTVIRAFDISTSESLRVVNALAAGISQSKLQIEDLRTAFNYMGVAANLFNVSLEDTIAWLGVLRDRGLKASTIGTSFRGVLATLVNETDKFSNVLKNLPEPLGFADVTIRRGRSLETAIKRLSDAGFNISDAFEGLQRRTAMTFGLMVQNIDAFSELSDKVTETNRAVEMNEIAMKGMQSQLAQTKSIFDEFMLAATRSGGSLEIYIRAFKIVVQVMASGILTLSTMLSLLMKGVAAIGLLGEAKITLPSGPMAETPFAGEQAGGIDLGVFKEGYKAYQKDVEQTIEKFMQTINRIVGKEGLFGEVMTRDEENINNLKKRFNELAQEKDRLLALFRAGDIKKGTKEYENLEGKLSLVNAQLIEIKANLNLMEDSIAGPIKGLQELMAEIAIKPGASSEEILGVFRKGTKDIELMQQAINNMKVEFEDLVRKYSEREFFKGSAEYERMLALAKQLTEAQKKLDAAKKRAAKEVTDELKKQVKAYEDQFKQEVKHYTRSIKERARYEKEFEKIDNNFAKFKRKLFKDLAKEEIDEYEKARAVADEDYKEKMRLYNKLLTETKKHKAKLQKEIIGDPFLIGDLEQAKALIKDVEGLLKFINLLHEEQLENIGDAEDIAKGFRHGFRDATKEIKDQYQLWKDATKETMLEMRDTLSDVFFDSMNDELKSASDYWQAFTNTIKRHIADIAASWITSGIFGGTEGGGLLGKGFGFIKGLFSHSGGLQRAQQTGGHQIRKMHVGGLNSNEFLRILKGGEYEIKPSSVRSIGVDKLDYMNRTGQMPSGGNVTYIDNRKSYISAIDMQSFDQALRSKGSKAIHDVALNSFSRARFQEDRRVR